ncbi:MAG: TetR/AcrR family transcriptional regulator [Pseudomonadota bacterium]
MSTAPSEAGPDGLKLLERGQVEPPTARGRATRAKLVAAAERCFAESGFDGTTVAAIAAAADVSHGNFYRHFADKDQALIAVIAGLYGNLRSASGAEVGGGDATEPTLAGLTRRNIAFFRNYAERRHLFRVTREAAARPDADEFRDMWLTIRQLFVTRSARWIRKCQAAGQVTDRLNADEIAAALGAMTEQMAYVELGLAKTEPTRAAVDRLGETSGLIWHRVLTCETA